MKFKEIEKMLGEELPLEADGEAFWTDKALMTESSNSLSADDVSSQSRPISDCWEFQGYTIQHLDLEKKKIVFRRKQENISGLIVPKYLVERPLPDAAIREANEFFKRLKKKYGL